MCLIFGPRFLSFSSGHGGALALTLVHHPFYGTTPCGTVGPHMPAPSEASSSLKWIHCKFSMQLSPAHLADVRAGIGEQLGNSMLRRETLCGSPCRPPLTGAGAGCRYNTSLGGVALMFDRLAIKSDLAVISSDAPVVFVPIEAPTPMPLPPCGHSFSPSLKSETGGPRVAGAAARLCARGRPADGGDRPPPRRAQLDGKRRQEMATDGRRHPSAGHGQITLDTTHQLLPECRQWPRRLGRRRPWPDHLKHRASPGWVAEEGRVPCSVSRAVAPARRGAREMGRHGETWGEMHARGARGGPEDDESEAALGGPAPPGDDSEAFV